MLFSRRRHRPEVSAGSVYRRNEPNNVTEIARVDAVWADSAGIEHVEFDLRIQQRETRLQDRRTLSIDAFAERYQERMAGA